MNNWKANIKHNSLNSDPKIIRRLKRIRKYFRNIKRHTKLIKVIFILFIISAFFIIYLEHEIKDNILFKIIFMTLNMITFIGVFFPMSIHKTLTNDDVKNTISSSKKEDRENERLEKMSSF